MRETAHEIRTPMNTVALGFQIIKAELLESSIRKRGSCASGVSIGVVDGSMPGRVVDPGNPPSVGAMNLDLILQMVDDTKASADIAVDLVSDLLLYDRLEVGGLQLARTPLKLWTLVKENLALFNIQVSVEKDDYDCTIRSCVLCIRAVRR